jgi:hypothetical protein
VNTIKLELVQYVPKQLVPGILYVSETYSVAAHLCACGCGNKVVTPLGPAEWSFTEKMGQPSLWPSVGNWQLPCRSHYIIGNGNIHWAGAWSDAQIAAGRNAEEHRLQAYYAEKAQSEGFLNWLWRLLQKLFGR